MPVTEQQLTAGEALSELQEILHTASLDVSPPRIAASRYTLAREVLLHSHLRPFLPGFLLQCMTIARFQEFIHLYHPSIEARLRFVEESFRPCMPWSRTAPRPDPFGAPDF